MLAQFLFLNLEACHRTFCLLLCISLSIGLLTECRGNLVILLLLLVTLSPGFFDYWRFCIPCISQALRVLLSMLLHEVLVLCLVDLLRTLLMCLRHLLSHYLCKGIVSTSWIKPSLCSWLWLSLVSALCLLGPLEVLDIRLCQAVFGVWLPLSIIELRV
jgi:hypothetical protein